MKVTIAGNVKDIKEGTTLAQLVVDEKVENPEYVTVTVNDDFVENHDRSIALHNSSDSPIVNISGCNHNRR